MEIEKVSADSQSKHAMPYTFEKSYSLKVESCLKFENEFMYQEQKDGVLIALVQITIINELKKADLIIENFQHSKMPGVELQEIITLEPEQRIKKGGAFKFILKMKVIQADISSSGSRINKNLGRVQFEWKTSKNDIDGGILAYGLDSKENELTDVIRIECVEPACLKVHTLTTMQYKITNT
jgi:hypothetical protein